MNELPVLNDEHRVLVKINDEWKAIDASPYGDILIKIHSGEVKQVETTKKEKY